MSNYDESFESVTTSGSSSSSNSAEEEVPKKVVEAPMVPVAVAAPVPMPVLPVELPQSPKVTLPPPIPVPATAGGTGEAESAHASPLMDGSSQSNSKTEASTSVASSGQPEFKYLSNFVAFGSQSQSARSSQQMPRAESESYANNTEETGTDKSPFHSPKPSIPSVQAPPPVTPAIPTPPVVIKDEEQSAKVDDSSSVFSTLSQNVKFKSPMAETLAPKEMEAGRAQYTPPPVLADSPPPPVQTTAATSATEQPKLTLTMPEVPKKDFTLGAPKEAPLFTFTSDPPPPSSSSPPPPAASFDTRPPPPAAPLSPEDAKVVQLRETSEAVERLINAFASLRGHSDAHRERTHEFEHRETVIGKRGSAKVTTKPVERPPPSEDIREKDRRTAASYHEKTIEDIMASCIMDVLLENTTPYHGTTTRGKGSNEVIPAGDFRQGESAPFKKSHGQTYSVFDNEMRAFAPDECDGDAVLRSGVQEALHKYVFNRIIDPYKPIGVPITSPIPTVPISPYVAWSIVVDLAILCHEVLLHLHKGVSVPILVRYCGEPGMEQLARNAIHCLPFEALEGQSVFKLEYWVTAPHLQSIIFALNDTLRGHFAVYAKYMVQHSFGEEYILQNNEGAYIIPPQQCLFALVGPGTVAGDGDRGARKIRVAPPLHKKEEEESLLPPNALSITSFAVSKICTSVAEKDGSETGTPRRIVDGDDFNLMCQCVSQTVADILSDVSIQSTVERRALDMFHRKRKEANDFKSKSRAEKEKSIIDKAEEEAQLVVERILQEMKMKSSGSV